MKDRCLNPRSDSFSDYGGRGITVCDKWLNDFAAFIADMGPKPAGLTLDRIDNNGNYEPGNCRWATHKEQAGNRREKRNAVRLTIGGVSMTIYEAEKEFSVKYQTIWNRLKRQHLSDEEAVGR